MITVTSHITAIEKNHIRPAGTFGNICHDFSVATRTDNT